MSTSQPRMGLEQGDRYGIEAALAEANRPGRPVYKSRWFWVVVSLVVVVLAIRIALNPIAASFTQKGLDSITGYRGSFKSVSVSIIPLAYSIEDLKLVQRGHEGEEPEVYVHQLRAQILLRKLLRLQPVATVGIDKAKVTVKAGATKPPPEAKQAAKEGAKEVEQNEFNLAATFEKILPMRVDRIEVRDSELTLIDVTDPKMPSFWVSDLQLAVENLATRRSLDQNVPLLLTMRATIAKTGTLKMLANADLLAEKPAFTGEAQLSDLQLQSLHAWTAAKAGVGATGALDMFVNFNSAKGDLSGDVKVLIKKPEVAPATDKLTDELKAKAANVAIKVLSDRVEGRDAIGTTLPIKGSIQNPDPQVWPTVLGVVRNAFVEGLSWGFSGLPTPTAKKDEGAVEQAAKALDKDEHAPKAQPEKSK